MDVIHLTDRNFKKEILDSKIPCLVDFWAQWCGPCRIIAPIVEDLAKEYDGRFKVAKLNIDDGEKTASNYGVMSIPTLMFFKGGKVTQQIVGAVGKTQIKSKMEELL